MYDYWGNEIRRHYQIETLGHATERLLATHDAFIVPSIQQLLGPAPLVSLTFELFQEGAFQLIFRVRATNAHRAQTVCSFVAAKKEGDVSRVAAIEHAILNILHARAPEHVVRPLLGGTIPLPARGQTAKPRVIYAYLAAWIPHHHELGVTRDLQFFINVKNRHVFTQAQTDDLKGQMIEIIARTYDPVKRECMEMPQIASGDFVVTKPPRGAPRLKLIACRQMLKRVTPASLIQTLLQAHWNWGSRLLRLMPSRPEIFWNALVRARGADEARSWLSQYRHAVAAGKFPQSALLSPAEIERLGAR